eukprot:m.50146 g.50146  ORF g.50146 m.50146 type:complete len:68 (+) comp17999_c0_seq1:36-239(+)
MEDVNVDTFVTRGYRCKLSQTLSLKLWIPGLDLPKLCVCVCLFLALPASLLRCLLFAEVTGISFICQ